LGFLGKRHENVLKCLAKSVFLTAGCLRKEAEKEEEEFPLDREGQ